MKFTTSLFDPLVPGIARDYPGRSLAICVDSTALPTVTFVVSSGIHFQGSADVSVFILPPTTAQSPKPLMTGTARARGAGDSVFERGPEISNTGVSLWPCRSTKHTQKQAPSSSLVDWGYRDRVAQLALNATGVARMQYLSTNVTSLQTHFTLRGSKYTTIDLGGWDTTFKFLVKALQGRLGVKQAWQSFVEESVATRYHVVNTDGVFLDGWFKMSADFKVDM